MKQIHFMDKHGGCWTAGLEIKRGIDFRRVMQEASALEKQIGGTVSIHLDDGKKWEDITDWVHRKALRLG